MAGPQRRRLILGAPAAHWWNAADAIAWDWSRGRYMRGGAAALPADMHSVTRAGAAYEITPEGAVIPFGVNEAPIVPGLGHSIWGQVANAVTSAALNTLVSGGSATLQPAELGPDGQTGSVYRFVLPATAGTAMQLANFTSSVVDRTVSVFAKRVGGANTNFQFYGGGPSFPAPTGSPIKAAVAGWSRASFSLNAGGLWYLNNGDDSYATDILVWWPQINPGLAASPPVPPAATRLATAVTVPDFAALAAAHNFGGGVGGRVAFDVAQFAASGTRSLLNIGSAANDRIALALGADQTIQLYVVTPEGAQLDLHSPEIAAPGLIEVEWQAKPGASYVNVAGLAPATADDAIAMPSPSSCRLGSSLAGDAYLNGVLAGASLVAA